MKPPNILTVLFYFLIKFIENYVYLVREIAGMLDIPSANCYIIPKKSDIILRLHHFLVRRMRLELTRHCCHYPLKVACIPISPPALVATCLRRLRRLRDSYSRRSCSSPSSKETFSMGLIL